MMPYRRRTSGWAPAAAASVTVAMMLAGCFNPFSPKVLGTGITLPPPAPNSPANTLRLLEWCYDNLEPSLYRELFTDDYRFAFSLLDPYGNAYRDIPWTREDELISTTKLFLGGDASQPAASSVTLNFDRNFNVRNDPRPGKRSKWHKSVRTSVAFTLVAEGSQTNVTGFVNFFLVRGDSALIPKELTDRGFAPDSSRWYIERWEDETAQPGTTAGGLRPAPPQSFATTAMPRVAGGAAVRSARAPGAGPGSFMRLVDHQGASTLPPQLSWGALKAIYR